MENKDSIKRHIDNIIYILKIIFKLSKHVFFINIILSVLDVVVGFINGVLIIRILLKMLSSKADFSEIINILIITIVFNFLKIVLNSAIEGFYMDKYAIQISVEIQKMVYKKAAKVKLKYFYESEFFNNFSFVLGKSVGLVWEVILNISSFIGSISSLILNAGIIFVAGKSLDSIILIVLMLGFSFISQFIQFKINKANFKLSIDMRLPERKRDYSRMMFYQRSFAKDFKCTDASGIFKKYFEENNNDITKLLRNNGKKVSILSGAKNILLSTPINIGVLICLAYRLIVLHNIDIGDFWGIYKGCNFIINANIFSIISSLYEKSLNIEKMKEFMNLEEEDIRTGLPIPDAAKSYDLEFINVSFIYPGTDKYILRNINLKIKNGERIVFVGFNGAGKTTLIHLLLRLYEPTEGKILLNGKDICQYDLILYRNLFGITLQDYRIYPYSIAENVLMDKKSNIEDYENVVIRSLEKCDIYNKISDLPDNINTNVSKEYYKDGIILSGGENQRLAISRMFAKKNKIYVLDEPTSSMDPISEANIYKSFIDYTVGKTAIFATHRLTTVKDADRIYLVENGNIVEKGSHDDLMKANNKYANLYNIQANFYLKRSV